MPWYNVHEITACKQQKAAPGNDKEVSITLLFSKSLILYSGILRHMAQPVFDNNVCHLWDAVSLHMKV